MNKPPKDIDPRRATLQEKMQYQSDLDSFYLVPSRITPQCQSCIHYDREGHQCPAFPDGIPTSIELNRYNHTRPYPGQKHPHTILWAPREPGSLHPLPDDSDEPE
jgi:hypothetical protein